MGVWVEGDGLVWDCLLMVDWTLAESGVEVGDRMVGGREGGSPGEE